MATTTARSTPSNLVKKDNLATALDRALDAGAGLLRLTPTWVPRSFLHPGKRIKLAPTDWYAYGPIVAASTSAGSAAPPKPPTKTATPMKG